jgi:hypothetical protein
VEAGDRHARQCVPQPSVPQPVPRCLSGAYNGREERAYPTPRGVSDLTASVGCS